MRVFVYEYLTATGTESGPLARDFLLGGWAPGESRDYHVRITVKPGGVGDEVVRRFLQAELDPAPKGAALEHRVLLAQGSIGRALVAGGQSDSAQRAAEQLQAAIRGGPARWAAAALAQAPWSARGDFTETLDALSVRLRDGAAKDARANPERLRRHVAALKAVEQIRVDAQGNLNPQLALAVLAMDLEALA